MMAPIRIVELVINDASESGGYSEWRSGRATRDCGVF
jgi:hypothetical protein